MLVVGATASRGWRVGQLKEEGMKGSINGHVSTFGRRPGGVGRVVEGISQVLGRRPKKTSEDESRGRARRALALFDILRIIVGQVNTQFKKGYVVAGESLAQ